MEQNLKRKNVFDFMSIIVNSIWFLLFLCGLNLLVMHYYILNSCQDTILDATCYADNVVGVYFDVCAIYILVWLLILRKTKISLSLLFLITWLWSFSNIMYSRFFFNYLTLSAIGQGESLIDDLILRCIFANFRWIDLYYPLVAVLFFYFLSKLHVGNIPAFRKLLVGLFLIALVDLGVYVAYCLSDSRLRYASFFLHKVYSNNFIEHLNYSNPNLSHFLRGEIRNIIPELWADIKGNIELTETELREIRIVKTEAQNSMTSELSGATPKNLIFILIESYMSFTSDLKISGKEVTPFLNSLKNSPGTYYNGNVNTNVTLGCSSDGQFIYMTGLLPLRSIVTLSRATHVTLPGMPKQLKYKSRMVIPTVKSVWDQDRMCEKYGFNELYTSLDYSEDHDNTLTDEQVFELAIQKDVASNQPFFSVVLTISMHQPYTKQIDLDFVIDNSSMQSELACYLNACHYTDKQIEKYIRLLKEHGLYDNSIIVIAADHPVFSYDFGDPEKHIPLYIINSSGLPKDMWRGECNQVDVYTTLLDLLGCKSNWYGLGHSLVSPEYKNSVSDRTWNVSEWIIMGDYFSK